MTTYNSMLYIFQTFLDVLNQEMKREISVHMHKQVIETCKASCDPRGLVPVITTDNPDML